MLQSGPMVKSMLIPGLIVTHSQALMQQQTLTAIGAMAVADGGPDAGAVADAWVDAEHPWMQR